MVAWRGCWKFPSSATVSGEDRKIAIHGPGQAVTLLYLHNHVFRSERLGYQRSFNSKTHIAISTATASSSLSGVGVLSSMSLWVAGKDSGFPKKKSSELWKSQYLTPRWNTQCSHCHLHYVKSFHLEFSWIKDQYYRGETALKVTGVYRIYYRCCKDIHLKEKSAP